MRGKFFFQVGGYSEPYFYLESYVKGLKVKNPCSKPICCDRFRGEKRNSLTIFRRTNLEPISP